MNKLLFAIFAMLMTGAASAAEPLFAERVVRMIPATGECVGRNDDPICVFDTIIACVIRDDADLCKKVGVKYSQNMKNAMAHLGGQDYKYAIVDMYVNRRKNVCTIADDKSCVMNAENGKLEKIDMSLKDANNVSVYLRREKDGKWQVIFATQSECWSDEDCS
ncbi:MAG: hypothetical protein LBB23_01995 [Rickettsiales bacterium]|jgi:hypothetical protein|nr:hypothetical protein [Rickettsiales bacterium]